MQALTRVYRGGEIRQIEQRAFALHPAPPLMERAGIAAARLAREMLANGKRVLVVAGPGNNGGDAFVCARQLKAWWFEVEVVFRGDASKLPPDAAIACQSWTDAGGTLITAIPDAIAKFDLVIDGLFGIGLTRPLSGEYAAMIEDINASGARVLALDVPSGLDADSGRIMGCAIYASRTITFLGLKPGLLTLDGPDLCGEITCDTLELDNEMLRGSSGHVLDTSLYSHVPKRMHNSHKGTYGSVVVIGGGVGMLGAAILTSRAALKLGAGRVYTGLIADNPPALDWITPELMFRAAEEAVSLDHATCLVVGPGAGQSPRAARLVDAAITKHIPLLLDADALNLVALDPIRASAVRSRKDATVITPHPAEAARLLAKTSAQIQADRVASALELAQRFNAITLLKGSGSICAFPDGRWFINTSGNAGLAAAGTGDVLAGIIAALVAQSVEPAIALLLGVHLHGEAADYLLAENGGPIGMGAQEIAHAARRMLNQRIYNAS